MASVVFCTPPIPVIGTPAARAHGRRGWEKLASDAPAVASVFERFGIQAHAAIAYHPWAKKIESIWRLLKKHCDRWFESFWGGRPTERPETAEELVKYHVEDLLPMGEIRELVLTAVETYNATPRRALGGLSPNMMFERYRGTVRRVDPDVFDTYFTVAEGPRRVGRDGLRYRNMLYELEAADLVKLQGRDVWVLPRLDDAGLVALCDKDERLLCYAAEQRLIRAGTKDEHVRAMFAKKARVRRLAKQYLAERDFLLDTTTGQILRQQRDFAKSREAELRKQAPAAVAPDVQVVRPDLADQAGRMKKKLSPFKRLAENAGAPGDGIAPPARTTRRAAFARLADNGIDVSAERRAKVDWSQQAGGVMDDAQTEQPRRRRIVADAG